MTNHIFWAPTPDLVAHTNNSAEMVREELLFAWFGHNIEEIGPGATKLVEAIDRWGDIDSKCRKLDHQIVGHTDGQMRLGQVNRSEEISDSFKHP